MARKIYYKVENDSSNSISDCQWDDLLRLQHWYNSEFDWTAGRLGFRMYAVFPNLGNQPDDADSIDKKIFERKKYFKDNGLSDNESILKLESEGLVVIQKGGYSENTIASGFTRVAGNEFNAYLVCEFLLKSSLILRDSKIVVQDEGEFIKSKKVVFHRGSVMMKIQKESSAGKLHEMILNRHLFSLVDPTKYKNFPEFNNMVEDFRSLDEKEKKEIISDWNWLGYAGNYDIHGDDIRGYDLNKKVKSFILEIMP